MQTMNRSELIIMITLRIVGIAGLFAIPAVFLPFEWMDAIHGYLGLGDLPDAPIVRYLARSLSAFYAIVAAITLRISTDLRRYRPIVHLWGVIILVIGVVLLGIDVEAKMPLSWMLFEGPPTIAIGLLVLWLCRGIAPSSTPKQSVT